MAYFYLGVIIIFVVIIIVVALTFDKEDMER